MNLMNDICIFLTYLLNLFTPGGTEGCNQGLPVTMVFSSSLHFTPSLSSVFEIYGQSSSPSFLGLPLQQIPSDEVHFIATFEILLGPLLTVCPNHLNLLCYIWVMIFL